MNDITTTDAPAPEPQIAVFDALREALEANQTANEKRLKLIRGEMREIVARYRQLAADEADILAAMEVLHDAIYQAGRPT